MIAKYSFDGVMKPPTPWILSSIMLAIRPEVVVRMTSFTSPSGQRQRYALWAIASSPLPAGREQTLVKNEWNRRLHYDRCEVRMPGIQ